MKHTSINLLKWAEKTSLGFEASTSAITFYQTIAIPSHPHHFEEILSAFLEVAAEWEEILLCLTRSDNNKNLYA
ncbi:MAG: type III secretion system chaperone [Rhabdochlamydiaceae bacterium]